MPTPTATTSNGTVIKPPIGDASARAMRIAGCAALLPRERQPVLATALVDEPRGQLEGGQKAALAARGVEPDARRTGPQVRRIFGRVRRQLVRQRARGGVPEHDELAAVVRDFFANYRGKLVVFGHTTTRTLPNELSTHTPEDPTDLWAGPSCIGLDTACGKGGFLTAFELPARLVYESRG